MLLEERLTEIAEADWNREADVARRHYLVTNDVHLLALDPYEGEASFTRTDRRLAEPSLQKE